MEKDLAEEMVERLILEVEDALQAHIEERPRRSTDETRVQAGRRLLIEWIRALEDDWSPPPVVKAEEACREWLGLLPPGAPAADDEQRQQAGDDPEVPG